MGDEEKPKIPEVIVHFSTGDMYRKGEFLGKGYFAQCHVIANIQTNAVYAAKIIPQSHISYSKSVLNEVSIHGKLNHKHVVKLHGFFEDLHYGYILMEICNKGNMQEMLKPRVFLTEPEVRYYMKQILAGVSYLHTQLIIHRDLKLGNLLLTDELKVKIGDFGTAVQSSKGAIHHGICGTPNYIAPEVVTDAGHSFEFDIFSTGCILYTLLLGIPPFQDTTRERVFERVQICKYNLPIAKPSQEAKDLIRCMLQLNPSDRPTVQQSLSSQFMKGFMPASMPLSSLTEPPQFEQVQNDVKSNYNLRKPLREVNRKVRLTSVSDLESEKRTSPFSKRSCIPKVQSQKCQNITNKVLAIAEESQMSTKPQDRENLEPCDTNPNPFDISEKLQPIVCPQCGKETNIFSGHCSCKSVEHNINQPQELIGQSVGRLQPDNKEEPHNKIFSWLETDNLEHKRKLMNRLCGMSYSNIEKGICKSSNRSSDRFATEQSLVHKVTQEQQDCTDNLKKKSVTSENFKNNSVHNSPGDVFSIIHYEPTKTEKDTHTSKLPLHESKVLEDVDDRSQIKNVIMSSEGMNMQSGVEAIGPTIEKLGGQTDASIRDHEKESFENYGVSVFSNDTRLYSDHHINKYILSLYNNLKLILNSGPGEKGKQFQVDQVDNSTSMTVRVLRWHEFASENVFAYQLSNGSIGCLFNDGTNLVLLSDGTNFRFANNEGEVSWCTWGHYSTCDDNRVMFLLEFKKSIEKCQDMTGNTMPQQEDTKSSPYVVKRYTDSAMPTVMMLLTNGTFQIDILIEDTQIIFYPQLTTIMFINANKQLQTLQLKSILESGCCPELSRSFQYAFDAVSKITTGTYNELTFCSTSIRSTEKIRIHTEVGSLKKLKLDMSSRFTCQ